MKQATVNTLGALGYSSIIIQWFWAILTIGLSFFISETMQRLFLPAKQPTDSAPLPVIELPSSLEITIMILSVIFALGVIIYALAKVPQAIGRGGQQLTRRSAKLATPRLAAGHRLSKKQRRRLFEYVTWSIKLLLLLVPLMLLVIPPASSLGLSHSIVATTGGLFAGCSLLLFGLQYLLAHCWRIPAKQVW